MRQRIFGGLQRVIVDELHALAGTKRGDLLALGPGAAGRGWRRTAAASASPPRSPTRGALQQWLSPTARTDDPAVAARARPRRRRSRVIRILEPRQRMPWSGHMALFAMEEVYLTIKAHRTTLVFVNTRAQAELVFQALWRLNDDNLPIALHHGSLAPEQRRKVEAAMARGGLRAVVATSSLDLGIDWAAVDLVLQVGAPKGASRLIQRIGRANHRLDEPSGRSWCRPTASRCWNAAPRSKRCATTTLDGEPPRLGGLDVLAQHILGMACAAPFAADALYDEVRSRRALCATCRAQDFDDVLDFVATGGYALKSYERWQRLSLGEDGAVSPRQPACGAAIPDECRHHRARSRC